MPGTPAPSQLLTLPLPPGNDALAPTLGGYLLALLSALCRDGEGFSARHPFGREGWKRDLYVPMVAAGMVPGEIDGDGYLIRCDTEAADTLILDAIAALSPPHQLGCICAEILDEGGDIVQCPVHHDAHEPFGEWLGGDGDEDTPEPAAVTEPEPADASEPEPAPLNPDMARALTRATAIIAEKDAEIGNLSQRLDLAASALAGDREGIRLWMLDCAASAGRHRARAGLAECQLAQAVAALRRLSLNDEMAGMGQRDSDPEAIARCRHAAGALETIARLAAGEAAASPASHVVIDRASIECVLLDHAAELSGDKADANLAELAYCYKQATGWDAIAEAAAGEADNA